MESPAARRAGRPFVDRELLNLSPGKLAMLPFRSKLIFVPMVFAALLSSVSGQEVKWLRSAEQAAQLAQRSEKPILIYVRSANCGYCDLMQKNVWGNADVAKIIMSDFIPLKLTREENAEAVESLKIKGYPTTMVFSANRAYIGQMDGYVAPAEFMANIRRARVAEGPIEFRR